MPSVTGTSVTAQAKVHVAVGGCPCWDMLSTALWARRWAEAEGQTLHFPRKTNSPAPPGQSKSVPPHSPPVPRSLRYRTQVPLDQPLPMRGPWTAPKVSVSKETRILKNCYIYFNTTEFSEQHIKCIKQAAFETCCRENKELDKGD